MRSRRTRRPCRRDAGGRASASEALQERLALGLLLLQAVRHGHGLRARGCALNGHHAAIAADHQIDAVATEPRIRCAAGEVALLENCLLYTSDAADEEDS